MLPLAFEATIPKASVIFECTAERKLAWIRPLAIQQGRDPLFLRISGYGYEYVSTTRVRVQHLSTWLDAQARCVVRQEGVLHLDLRVGEHQPRSKVDCSEVPSLEAGGHQRHTHTPLLLAENVHLRAQWVDWKQACACCPRSLTSVISRVVFRAVIAMLQFLQLMRETFVAMLPFSTSAVPSMSTISTSRSTAVPPPTPTDCKAAPPSVALLMVTLSMDSFQLEAEILTSAGSVAH